ncbi:putative Transposon TX1 [Gossypium australe]|uniref:Putative Transposon TX1 n=1 Tax=Gossypium australe TaxID=47621 RepID=A0A5B6VIM5_9ROSI|nr:putative Transposon TX1 [Gossypium australe]
MGSRLIRMVEVELVIRDFNGIAYSLETKIGLAQRESQMSKFLDNGRTQTNNIRECLDRGVANTNWWNLFQNYRMYHLTHSLSDHCLIFLNSNMDKNHAQRWHFIFEIASLLEETCKSEATSSGNVPNRLKVVGVGLDVWFKKIQKEISLTKKELEKQLVKLNDAYPTDEVLGDIIATKLAPNMEADKEELYWKQRKS